MSLRHPLVFAALAAVLAVAPTLSAKETKDDADGKATKGDKADKGDDKGEDKDDADAPPAKKKVEPKVEKSASDPKEDPGKSYYFAGLRYRHSILPKFMLNLFVAGGPTSVSIPSFGIEGGLRKDGFETVLAITWADWSMAPFPFKGKDEADEAFEIVKSDLKLWNLSVDMLWSAELSKSGMFQFVYGATAGISIVTGELQREQAMPSAGPNASPTDPYTYVACTGPGTGRYCDSTNNHYNGYTEASWFNGGKKPNIYAIFGPMLGFRIKPVKQFVARIDVGWNLFIGPTFGLGLQYGF